MKRNLTSTSRLALSVMAAAALLSACGRGGEDNRTAGQKVDAAIAQTEQKAEELKAEAKEAGRDARQAASNTTDAIANKSRDVAITTELKAELARDDRLRASDINVDTSGGQVILRGSAPDTAARERATQLAMAVHGVVNVDNPLNVQAQ